MSIWHQPIDPLRELLHALAVSGGIVLLMVVAECWRRFGDPPVEWTRKLVHLGSGVLATGFSWWFGSPWTVLALGVGFVALLLATRASGILRSVHGVERRSAGDILFPVATLVTFVMAWRLGQPLFYSLSIAILTLSDTMAAIVGRTYGLQHYRVDTERKSLEGSVFFFLTSFLVLHLGLLLGTDLGRLECVLISLWISSMTTCFEAISVDGTDNMFVPLGTLFLLWKITGKDLAVIATDLASFAGAVGLCFALLIPRRKLDSTSILGLALLLNAAARLVEWHWALPILCALLLFNYGNVVRERFLEGPLQVRTVFFALGATTLWVFVANLGGSGWQTESTLGFLANLGSTLAVGWTAIWTRAHPNAGTATILWTSLGRSAFLTGLLLAPMAWFEPILRHPVVAVCLGACLLASQLGFARLRTRATGASLPDLIRRSFLLTLGTSLAGAVVLAAFLRIQP